MMHLISNNKLAVFSGRILVLCIFLLFPEDTSPTTELDNEFNWSSYWSAALRVTSCSISRTTMFPVC